MEKSAVELSKERSLETAKASAVRVLHVDDDACFLETAKAILEMQRAFQVDTASCVEEAWGKMKKEKYDAVISDYQVPGKDGLQFLEELRKSGNGIPFILFTGKGREEVAIRALNLGADGYINKQGSPETVYGELAHSVKSVVARRKAEEALRSSEEKYRAYLENSPVAFFVTNSARKYEEANDAACKLLGYSREELLEMTTADVVFEGDTPLALKHLCELNETGKSRLEFKLKRKDGEPVHVILNTVKLPNGKRIGFCEDITERKKAEEALQESEERFRAIVETAPFGYYRVGKDGLWQYVNPMWERMHGLSLEEVVGKSLEITQTEEDVEQAKEYVKRALAGETIVGEFSRLTHDGDVGYHSFNIQPVKHDNEIVAIEGFINNITERKKAEDALEKERQELDRIINSAPIIVFYKDKEGKLLRVNRAFAETLQMPQEDFIGKTVFDFYSAEIAQSMTSDDLEVLESRCPKLGIIEQHESASGLRWLQTDKIPIFDETGVPNGIIGFAQDITERKQAEESLRESESRFRTLIEKAPIAIGILRNGIGFYANPMLLKMLGLHNAEETVGRPIEELFAPQCREEIKERWRLQALGLPVPIEFESIVLRPDGSQFPIQAASVQVQLPDGKADITFTTDITERKKAEDALNGAKNQLTMANEKLGVVGQLTRHDVRNKLSAVIGNTYLAKKMLSNDHKALDYLRNIESACSETTRVLDFATAYESLGVEGLALVGVDRAVEEAVSLVSELKGLKVVNNCQGLTVMADSALSQLFFNLIENSLKHGKNVGQIKICYEEGKDRLKLFYEDNGVGIPKASKPKLFDVGFTTGNGSGLGLPLIKRMMEIYGWTIEEAGEPGKGAKFVITIPMRADSNQKQRKSNKKTLY